MAFNTAHYAATLVVVLQARVSASTVVLRNALIQQQKEQQAAVDSLAITAGCNRTVDMQYAIEVGLQTSIIATFWYRLPQSFCVQKSLLCI